MKSSTNVYVYTYIFCIVSILTVYIKKKSVYEGNFQLFFFHSQLCLGTVKREF